MIDDENVPIQPRICYQKETITLTCLPIAVVSSQALAVVFPCSVLTFFIFVTVVDSQVTLINV